MGILKNIFSGGATDFMRAGKEIIDEAFTSKEEKQEAYQKLFETSIKDRQNARDMYVQDSWLQKIYAIVFLLAYVGLTAYMIYIVLYMSRDSIAISEFGNTLIASVWGGMTTKVGTITDFLFGGSNGERNKDLLNNKLTLKG